MTSMQKYKFAHLWLSRNGKFVGRATAAFTSNGANQLTASFAFCDPNDRYYRDKGRADAVKAYEANKVVSFTVSGLRQVGPKQVWAPAAEAANILQTILGGGLKGKHRVVVPSFAKKRDVKVTFNGETGPDIRSQHRPTFDYLAPEPERRRWMVISQVEQGDAFCAGPFPSEEEAKLVQRVVSATDPTVKIIQVNMSAFDPKPEPGEETTEALSAQ